MRSGGLKSAGKNQTGGFWRRRNPGGIKYQSQGKVQRSDEGGGLFIKTIVGPERPPVGLREPELTTVVSSGSLGCQLIASCRCRVSALNLHRPEKKKRKKLMKDSLHLANMLRRFTREKEELRRKNVAAGLQRPKVPPPSSAGLQAQHKADCSMADLSADPAVMSLLGSANNDVLHDMMGDLDFGMLDSPQPSSPAQGENGSFGGQKAGGSRVVLACGMTPPPLPGGLPAALAKRIEDLRAVRPQKPGHTEKVCDWGVKNTHGDIL